MDTARGLVDALADRRRREGLTQLQVARHCGVSQATVSRIEDGQADPTLQVLHGYAAAVRSRLEWRLTSQ